MDSFSIIFAFILIAGLITVLSVHEDMEENKELEEKAKLIMDVKDSTVHETFCRDFCYYDTDSCNENCLEGIKKGLKE